MTQPQETSARTIFQQLDRTAKFPYSFQDYARRFAWELAQNTLIRFSFRRAHRWRRFWLRCFGAKIPSTSGTKATCRIMHPWLFSMGDYSMVSDRVVIYNLGQVTIGSHSVLSQDVYVCAGTHDHTRPNLPLIRSPITIGSGVWICAGAFICPDVTVGDNSLVGARAVVTRNVPPGVIVAGNPARVMKDRPMDMTL